MKESSKKMMLAMVEECITEANRAKENLFKGKTMEEVAADTIENKMDLNFISDKIDWANRLLNILNNEEEDN